MASFVGKHDPRGTLAEGLAYDHLRALGWQVLGRNVRVGRLELDLIARERDVMVVVEVRGRGPRSWLRPLDSVDTRKRGRLRLAGEQLWRSTFVSDASLQRLRFDVIAIRWDELGGASLEHVRAAF